MKLRLKQENKNITINRNNIVVKTATLKPAHYQYYYDNGFSDLFTVVKETIPTIKYEGVEEKPKKKRKTKTKKDGKETK